MKILVVEDDAQIKLASPELFRGPAGADGVSGKDGAEGPQGPIGLTGPAGESITGAPGIDGEDGAPGPTGPQGPQGDIGFMGPQGRMGLTGDQGPTGPIGMTGPKGDQGPQGPQGDPGEDGADAALPDGGVPGDVLTKDYKNDVVWQAPPLGGGGGGFKRTQINTINSRLDKLEHANGVPAGGTINQVLVKRSSVSGDVAWETVNLGDNTMFFAGAWNDLDAYMAYSVVTNGGSAWVAVQNNSGVTPGTDPLFWSLLVSQGDQGDPGLDGAGFVWSGSWDAGTTYHANEITEYHGSSWISLQDGNNNNIPSGTPAFWHLLASKGDQGDTGPAGPLGLTGTQGPAGPTGPTGAQGPIGPQGDTGGTFVWAGVYDFTVTYQQNFLVRGASGNVYVSLVDNNTNHTPEVSTVQWQLYLSKGGQGIQGVQGVQGDKGDKGDTGATGQDGEGFSWSGAWDHLIHYQKNDIVEHLGSSFISLVDANVNSAPDPNSNSANWELLAHAGDTGPTGATGPTGPKGDTGDTGATGAAGAGFTWSNVWSTGVTYAINNVVSKGGSSFISLQNSNLNHSPDFTTPGDTAYWALMSAKGATGDTGSQGIQGIQGATGATGATGAAGAGFAWEGPWDSGTTYAINQIVQRSGSSWISKQNSNIAHDPNSSPSFWDVLAEAGTTGSTGATGSTGQGFTNQGAWLTGTNYHAYDVVTDGGQTFLCILNILPSTTAPASDTTHFLLWAAKGATGAAGSNGTNGTSATGGTDIQIFLSGTGTWAKPAGATANSVVHAIVIGAGAGGASGSKCSTASSLLSPGGGAGGGGARKEAHFKAGDLGSTETVIVGAKGTGGAAVTATSGNGVAGTAGGDSSFGSKLKAHGGGAASASSNNGAGGASFGGGGAGVLGKGGDASTVAAGVAGTYAGTIGGGIPGAQTGTSAVNPIAGGSGGASPEAGTANGSTCLAGDGGDAMGGAAGGGAGGGRVGATTSTQFTPGAKGGRTGLLDAATQAAGGVVGGPSTGGPANPTAGANGTPGAWGFGGGGGAGGGPGRDVSGAAGGNGGFPGGGGGGGGADIAVNTSVGSSGKGGDGADGVVIVITIL